MLNKGCVWYLASLVEDESKKPEFVDILIVREYQDVFLNELLGQPPTREVEFLIDLVSSTASILKAPFRMALAELKDLKEQLEDLLNNGFIRPSVSLWEAPVLFMKKKDGSLWLCIDYRQLNKEP